jgi:predicted RNA-binding protein with TRAM domain
MVKEGRLTSCDVKVPKKGKVKGYTAVVKPAEVGEDNSIQVTDTELNSMF